MQHHLVEDNCSVQSLATLAYKFIKHQELFQASLFIRAIKTISVTSNLFMRVREASQSLSVIRCYDLLAFQLLNLVFAVVLKYLKI